MTPSNEPPEIPSLKPSAGKDDEKKGGGLLPPASSASKPAPSSSGFKFPGFGSKGLSAPNLRVRGMAGGSTVMDRLKNLRKKDLIFIAAGLCTLGMAPLAEHLLMSPEEQSGKLQEGFDSKGPLFADGSTVYEQGSGVGSPGGLVGQGTDVITPLNVRDPSNLVMSPGATKKPDAVVPPPPPPSTGKSEPDWRDVLKDSAKSGASKGTQAAPKLPKPNVKMAGAIRGLSALGGGGGGTGAALKLDPLKASAPNRAAESNALTRSQATPGFRGATSRSNASSGAGEALRAAGMRQSDIFNRGGSAANALETASKEAIPTGGSGVGGGGPGKGDESKNPGGNNVKESKQLGESLAFLRKKMEQEKSIDLKWKKKEWNEFGRRKAIEEGVIKMGIDQFGKFAEKAFFGPIADMIGQAVAGTEGTRGYQCTAGDFKFISKANFAKNECSFVGGTVACKNGLKATGCSDVTVHGSAPDEGSQREQERDQWSGRRRSEGQQRLAQREQRTADQEAGLRRARSNISAYKKQILDACKGLTSPQVAALKAKCDKLGASATSLEAGVQSLSDAAKELKLAWAELRKAKGGKDGQGGMDGEGADLGKLAGNEKAHLKAADDKLKEALEKLKILDDKMERTSVDDAKKALKAAADALKEAAAPHKAAQGRVVEINTALAESARHAQLAEGHLDTAIGKIGEFKDPGEHQDTEGSTTRYSEYRTAMVQAEKDARAAHRDLFTQYDDQWKTANGDAITARDALHGSAATPQLAVPPAAGASEQSDWGALGATYNNMVKNVVPLSAEANNPLLTDSDTRFQAFQQAVQAANGDKTKIDAARQAYNQGLGPQVAESNQYFGNAVTAVSDANGAVGNFGRSLEGAVTAGPGQQTAAVEPAPAPGG